MIKYKLVSEIFDCGDIRLPDEAMVVSISLDCVGRDRVSITYLKPMHRTNGELAK